MFFCYVAITQEVKAITINNNTKQAIDPINLHTKFYKDELHMFPLKEPKTRIFLFYNPSLIRGGTFDWFSRLCI